MTNQEPRLRVSAIIPVRNGEAYIAECIDSMLGQTVPPHEILVVEDGSTDRTADVVARYGDPVKLVQQPPRSQAAAFNLGVRTATGELVGFCDSDDLWPADKVERQLEVLERDPDLLLVSGLVQRFLSVDAPEAMRAMPIDTRAQEGHLIGTLLARREAFTVVGMFDESVTVMSGVDWVVRARTQGVRVETVDAVVLHRRVHGENLSIRSSEQVGRQLLGVLRADRQRRGAAKQAD